mmetsp:Transcript_44377/g.100106  ORF Transcript_44377/g.100106 Transcript_44377/m.100106 type:complete len:82 (+) Transcript_44377:75-320(+)
MRPRGTWYALQVDEVLNMAFMHPLSEDLVLVPGTTLPSSLFDMELTEEHLREAIFAEARFFPLAKDAYAAAGTPLMTSVGK